MAGHKHQAFVYVYYGNFLNLLVVSNQTITVLNLILRMEKK